MKKLQDYTNSVIETLFTKDVGFQDQLDYLLPSKEKNRIISVLKDWEQKMPRWEALTTEVARPEKLPRVEKYDPVGNCVERIVLPLETKRVRREVVEAGIFTSKTELEKFSKIYLLGQMGESGITCPLACTDGLIRVLSAHGSDFLKEKYVPLLSSSDYPLSGAQFITERAGGSDVGAIEGTARPHPEGHWLLTAEKWYCSAMDEFFLLAARPEGAPAGTKGVAIFFVPHMIQENGREVINNLSIRRLKDKLGTQSLPTAEIDFQNSKAHLIGKAEEGFHHLMDYVLNTSRVHNAAGSLACARRAFAEAKNYAEQRVAFGNEIIHYPLVQEHLLSILSSLNAKRNLYCHMLCMMDQNGWLPEDREKRLWQRFLINLMKYRTAATLTEQVKKAILVFGANGVIQDFCILPRLLRDALILENWEGTHNTLCLQILRDSQRFDFLGRLHQEVDLLVKDWPNNVLSKSKGLFLSALNLSKEMMTQKNLANPQWAETHAAHMADFVADLLEIGHLVKQGVAQKNNNILLQASYLTHEVFGNRLSRFGNPVLNGLSHFGLALVREESLSVKIDQY